MSYYLPDAVWHQLARDIVAAAQDPADPETAVKVLLTSIDIAPECARTDIELHRHEEILSQAA